MSVVLQDALPGWTAHDLPKQSDAKVPEVQTFQGVLHPAISLNTATTVLYTYGMAQACPNLHPMYAKSSPKGALQRLRLLVLPGHAQFSTRPDPSTCRSYFSKTTICWLEQRQQLVLDCTGYCVHLYYGFYYCDP
jgi:hypothetical protein